MNNNILKNEADNAIEDWGPYKSYSLKQKMRYVNELMKKWYALGKQSDDIDRIILDYAESEFRNNKLLANNVYFGYIYFFDETNKLIRNPNSLWEVYDNEVDKKSFFRALL